MLGFVEINNIYCHRLGTFSFNKSGFTSVYALFPVSKHMYDAVNTLYARNQCPLPLSFGSRLEPIYHPTSTVDGVLILALFDHGAHLCEDHKIDLCIALPDSVVNPCICDLVVLYDTGAPDYATQQLMRRAAEATRIDGLDRYETDEFSVRFRVPTVVYDKAMRLARRKESEMPAESGRIYISTSRIGGLKDRFNEYVRTGRMPAETALAQWPVKKEKTIGDVLGELTDEQRKVVYYLIGATEEKAAVGLIKQPIHTLIKKVVFSGPVTLVYWTDGGMTKVRRAKGERDDKEKAIGMALMKHLNGEKASYISHLGKIIESAGVVKPNPRSKKRKKDDGDNA